MKFVLFQLVFLCWLGLLSCEKKQNEPTVRDLNYSDCKGDLKSSLDSENIHFKMNSDNELLVEHQNVYFNCEPGKISVTGETDENNINIYEIEEQHMADCICPYDLSYKITGVNTGGNTISVFLMDYKKLECSLNLTIATDTIVQISTN